MVVSLENIFDLTGAEIFNPDSYKSISKVVIDSRKVTKNSIFVAIKGGKFDGHNFLGEAVANGAKCLVINKRYLRKADFENVTIVTVPNTIKALGELASFYRKKIKAKIVSITGSNGKTSSKDILSSILSEKYKVVKTKLNNNNHIGVPLSVFDCKRNTEVLVLEHGTNHFGEIEYSASIVNPDLAIITNIAESHTKYLIDKNGVYKEKSKLFDHTKSDGLLLINNDDPLIRKNENKYHQRKISFGIEKDADIKGTIIRYNNYGMPEMKIVTPKFILNVKIPLIGISSAKNVLCAVAVCYSLGMGKTAIQAGIKKLKPTKGRMEFIYHGDSVLVDDTYNSNPESLKASINYLSTIDVSFKKVLIIGEMKELGDNLDKIYRSITSVISKSKIDEVLIIGKLMKDLSTQLIKRKINCTFFNKRSSLVKYLVNNDFNKSAIVVKGSRSMKMEEFYNTLINKGK